MPDLARIFMDVRRYCMFLQVNGMIWQEIRPGLSN
jgi:hypothetical protein